ncbi:hypothetical protein Hte_004014 [Hypoxylon texense]
MSEQTPPSDEQLSIVTVSSHEEDIGEEDAHEEDTGEEETQEEKRNFFEHMSRETILVIFESMDSMGDVVALARTCQKAYAVFRGCEGPIAKAQILRMTAGHYKLPIMTIASRGVDAADKASIEQFFRDYLQQPTSWPPSCFSLNIIRALPSLLRAGRDLFGGLFAHRSFTDETAFLAPSTKLARAVSAACMLETASNLFYRRRGADSMFTGTSLYPELESAYWDLFSPSEAQEVVAIAEKLQEVQRELNIIARELQQRDRTTDGFTIRGFGVFVGIENLGRLRQHPGNMIHGHPKPRFQPDP